jgi:predicted metal-dependent HD superfamily phosphohydrolase
LSRLVSTGWLFFLFYLLKKWDQFILPLISNLKPLDALIDIEQARIKAKDLLGTKLSASLTYHCFEHTKWVVESSMTIAENEGITDQNKLLILESSAWFHDTGFTRMYKNHEQESCLIAKEILPGLGASPSDMDYIYELIMATSIPQTPFDMLGKIICDADLDYLGRTDFPEWSERLKQEWLNFEIITDEQDFYNRQFAFLKAYEYHTADARKRRGPQKRKYLETLSNNAGYRLTT